MILGIDHIAYSVSDREVEKVKDNFIRAGYSIFFQETMLRNLPIKRQFLTDYHPFHDLMLLKKAGNISIELLNHHSTRHQAGFWNVRSEKEVVFHTPNVTDSVNFWKRIGFSNTRGKTVEYNSVFSQLAIIFEQIDISPATFLDDCGFNSLALLTSSVDDERDKLRDICICSEIAELVVNQRILRIFFARNTTGEIVEFFEIRRDG